MKIISKEEEQAHYSQVIKGGLTGGSIGLTIGALGVWGASRRYAGFRSLTVPFRAFLVTSAGTASAIVTAERFSINFQRARDPMNFYKDESQRAAEELLREETRTARLMEWGRENRYSIVFASWLASMGVSWAVINRNKYMTTSQKLVQARMYAQGLALAVILASFAFETADARSGKGRWETVKIIDPNDPEHKKIIEKKIHKEEYEGQDLWKDMVAAEERRIEQRKREKAAEEARAAEQAKAAQAAVAAPEQTS